jgi:hypothetical protein
MDDPGGQKNTLAYNLKKMLMKVVVAVAAILFIFPHFFSGRSENKPEGVQRERVGAYYQALRYRARQER